MTSYTRKLYKTAPSAAITLHRRKKPGRLAAYFADASLELATFTVPSEGGKVNSRIEPEWFEVDDRLSRWSDRGWR